MLRVDLVVNKLRLSVVKGILQAYVVIAPASVPSSNVNPLCIDPNDFQQMGCSAIGMVAAFFEIDVLKITLEDSIKLLDPVPLWTMVPRQHWCTTFDLLL